MTTYVFEGYDVLNARIVESGFDVLRTKTKSGVTEIYDGSGTRIAAMNRSRKTFELNGVSRSTDVMKAKLDSQWCALSVSRGQMITLNVLPLSGAGIVHGSGILLRRNIQSDMTHIEDNGPFA